MRDALLKMPLPAYARYMMLFALLFAFFAAIFAAATFTLPVDIYCRRRAMPISTLVAITLMMLLDAAAVTTLMPMFTLHARRPLAR